MLVRFIKTCDQYLLKRLIQALYQVSSKTVPDNLNIKFRSKFNCVFANHGSFHGAILKVYPVFQEAEANEARDSKCLFQSVKSDRPGNI